VVAEVEEGRPGVREGGVEDGGEADGEGDGEGGALEEVMEWREEDKSCSEEDGLIRGEGG
jgi:hypothetical protein